MPTRKSLNGTDAPGVYDRSKQAYSDSNAPFDLERSLLSAAPATPPTGESVEWTPDGKSLYMLAPDGTVTKIGPSAVTGGSYPWTDVAVTATAGVSNQTITAVQVFGDLFTPAANGVYVIEATLAVTSAAATTGVQLAVTGPTTGVASSAVKIITASAAGTDLVTHTNLNTYQAAAAGLTTPNIAVISAIVRWGTTAATTGVGVGLKSEVALSAVTVLQGSVLRWRRVV